MILMKPVNIIEKHNAIHFENVHWRYRIYSDKIVHSLFKQHCNRRRRRHHRWWSHQINNYQLNAAVAAILGKTSICSPTALLKWIVGFVSSILNYRVKMDNFTVLLYEIVQPKIRLYWMYIMQCTEWNRRWMRSVLLKARCATVYALCFQYFNV